MSDNKASRDDILHLYSLLDETLQQAEREQLIACIKILGTAVASLKIRFNANEEQFPELFKQLLTQLEADNINPDTAEIMQKSIIECATAIAVTQQIKS